MLLILLSIGASCKLGSFAWKCESDKDCKSYEKCIKGQCFDDRPPQQQLLPIKCQKDSDCLSYQKCVQNQCWDNRPPQATAPSVQQVVNVNTDPGAKTCAAVGGEPCGGCCKESLIASDVVTCCKISQCVNRIQQKKVFQGLGETTIEMFSDNIIGVFYGSQKQFGKSEYAATIPKGGDTYGFRADGQEYSFSIKKGKCEFSVS